jgi:hypothetical protein
MRQLDSTHESVYRQNADESAGKSVRCVKFNKTYFEFIKKVPL